MISVNFHNLSTDLKHFCLAVVIPHDVLVSNLLDRAFEQIHFLEYSDPLKVVDWQFKLACEIIQDCYNVLHYLNSNSCRTFGSVDGSIDDSIHIYDEKIKSIEDAFSRVLELYKESPNVR